MTTTSNAEGFIRTTTQLGHLRQAISAIRGTLLPISSLKRIAEVDSDNPCDTFLRIIHGTRTFGGETITIASRLRSEIKRFKLYPANPLFTDPLGPDPALQSEVVEKLTDIRDERARKLYFEQVFAISIEAKDLVSTIHDIMAAVAPLQERLSETRSKVTPDWIAQRITEATTDGEEVYIQRLPETLEIAHHVLFFLHSLPKYFLDRSRILAEILAGFTDNESHAESKPQDTMTNGGNANTSQPSQQSKNQPNNSSSRDTNTSTQIAAANAVSDFKKAIEKVIEDRTITDVAEVVKAAIQSWGNAKFQVSYKRSEKSLDRYVKDTKKGKTARQYGRQVVGQIKQQKALIMKRLK